MIKPCSVVTLLLILWLESPALAEISDRFVGSLTNANAPPLSAAGLKGAFGIKADANGGVNLSQDFRGSTFGPLPGCAGDGVTNDTACVQAFVSAATSPVYLGKHLYYVTALSFTNSVTIIGSNGNAGVYAGGCTSGFVAGSSNIDLLTLTGNASKVEDTCFKMATAAGTNTSGAAVTVGVANSVMLHNNLIVWPFIGFDVSGNGGRAVQNLDTTLNTNVVVQPSPGGAAFRIGIHSTGGNTGDVRILNNSVECLATTTARGFLFMDAGGIMFMGNDSYGCGTGVAMLPGTGQLVENGFFYDVLGDTDSVNDLLIDAASVTAGTVQRIHFINTWTSSAGVTTALLKNTNGGVLQNISFVGHSTVLQNATPAIGIDIEAGAFISVQDSGTCGLANSSSTAIKIGAAATNIDITGDKVTTCGGTVGTGLLITSGANILQISGNDFAAATMPISYTPNNETAILSDNMPIDSGAANVASATTIALPLQGLIYITGTTPISTMTGYWSNRHVRLVSMSGSVTYNAGSGICTAVTVPQFLIANFTWSAGLNCWASG